jgi:hypothetical protein
MAKATGYTLTVRLLPTGMRVEMIRFTTAERARDYGGLISGEHMRLRDEAIITVSRRSEGKERPYNDTEWYWLAKNGSCYYSRRRLVDDPNPDWQAIRQELIKLGKAVYPYRKAKK